MADVTLTTITKRFGQTTALDGISLDINDGEFFVMLGPSGAGKTTTLRVIAGLETQDSGSVSFDGQPADSLAPPERDVAFVFQQYSLYPTMSVFDNMAFPLRAPGRRLSEAAIKEKVTSAAEVLRIAHLLTRKTAKLSGGEMQRVSIGRAIVRDPRIFLMDEPLSNLDFKLRESLRVELKHLQKTRRSTTLFVTHDQIEALTMADRIAVLDRGRLVQVGRPHDIYDRPATTFVAQLVGSPRINLFAAHRSAGQIWLEGGDIALVAPPLDTLPPSFTLGVRPEDIVPGGDGPFAGTVVLTEPLGVETVVHIASGQQTLVSTVPGLSPMRAGEQVRFAIASERLHFFGTDGARVG